MTTEKRATKKAAEPPRERANLRRGLVEQEIYDHATRLFAERGFAGTNFQDIADAVGLTRPALYHYVSSKNELLAKLVTEITEEPAKEIAAIARRDDLDAPGKIRAVVTSSVHRQGTQATRFQLLIRSEADLPAEIATSHASGRRGVLRSMVSIIEQGVADGSFRPVDPRTAALGVLGVMNWVAWWYTPDTRNDLDAIGSELADLAVAGLVDHGAAGAATGPKAAIQALRADLDRLDRMLDT